MIEWANRELSTLEGQLAFWKSGVARLVNGPYDNDTITKSVIDTLEKHVAEWRELMARHDIPVQQLLPSDREH
ncbi:hypothetical protein HYPDE_41073 [Hyphomicrobium denitrificans 1NES1]|uniref:Uncharacterized protein n=1 Tax=Hyphomicrobium denitrificans 1NES1 TaxID=670307 RepID=N0BA44_9HYPH|nr:hypothetical protein [Hyphomicrobium denitrificans]AGK59883.1 hypothetical protein HYPDE_41073 [Hyphomicrobium denitrificans 1NES1]